MRILILKVFPLIILFITYCEYAQTITLNVSVTDSTKHPVVEATVYLKEINRLGLTDESGKYSFGGIKPGDYNIKVQLAGYKEKSLSISISADTTLNIILGQTEFETESIDVTSSFKKS